MKESRIERKLVQEGKRRGIKFLKFKTPSRRHVPDRIAFLSGPLTVFVECKAPDEELRESQTYYCSILRKMGFKVYTLDNMNQIAEIIDEIISLSEESN